MASEELTRRRFLGGTMALGAALAVGKSSGAEDVLSRDDIAKIISTIKDAEIRAGVEAAISKNLLPAATQSTYPGHFLITADGADYGGDTTWPGIDSWQMCGAYLL